MGSVNLPTYICLMGSIILLKGIYSNKEYYIPWVYYLTGQYYLNHDCIKLINWEFIILVWVGLK